jgi:hypothetical protein
MVSVAKPTVRNSEEPVGHLFGVREVVQLHQLAVAVDRLVWEFEWLYGFGMVHFGCNLGRFSIAAK